jgi:hypothetical protein
MPLLGPESWICVPESPRYRFGGFFTVKGRPQWTHGVDLRDKARDVIATPETPIVALCDSFGEVGQADAVMQDVGVSLGRKADWHQPRSV